VSGQTGTYKGSFTAGELVAGVLSMRLKVLARQHRIVGKIEVKPKGDNRSVVTFNLAGPMSSLQAIASAFDQHKAKYRR
jgi:hypothetical protein